MFCVDCWRLWVIWLGCTSELVGEFGQDLVAAQGGRADLRLRLRGMVVSGSSHGVRALLRQRYRQPHHLSTYPKNPDRLCFGLAAKDLAPRSPSQPVS